MALPIKYSIENLKVRKISNLLTILGVALVFFIFVATNMLAAGLKKALATTGLKENIIIIRDGAQNELQSSLTREQADILFSDPAWARDLKGEIIGTKDVVILLSLKTKSDGKPANVNVRGVNLRNISSSSPVRNQIKIVNGRLPTPGTNEILVGVKTNSRFINTNIKDILRLAGLDWYVVGTFSANNSAFESEIWGDSDILMPALRRQNFSSVTIRLKPNQNQEQITARIKEDPRLNVKILNEQIFYEEQSDSMGKFIVYLGTFISIIFSLASIIGITITMQSSITSRIREIGILRAIGFSRSSIVTTFIFEALLITFLGAILGTVLASLTQFFSFSTVNFETFSDLTFGFELTIPIIFKAVVFSVGVALVGGIFPVIKASRIRVLEALRKG